MVDRKASLAAFYCVHNDDRWLECSMRSIYSSVQAIYLFVADSPWNGHRQDNSATLRCIEQFPDPERKLRVEHGDWKSEVEQRNHALARLTFDGHSHAWIIDADEIFEENQLQSAFSYALQRPEVTCWHCWFIHYWKSPLWRIDPPEQHHPPVLLTLGTGGFVEYRNCLSTKHQLFPPEVVFCHHLSYARTDAEIRQKLASFSHSHQVDPQWFENKWRRWDSDHAIEDLCPYNPGAFIRTCQVDPQHLPGVLRNFVGVYSGLYRG